MALTDNNKAAVFPQIQCNVYLAVATSCTGKQRAYCVQGGAPTSTGRKGRNRWMTGKENGSFSVRLEGRANNGFDYADISLALCAMNREPVLLPRRPPSGRGK